MPCHPGKEKTNNQVEEDRKMAPVVETVEEEETPEKSDFSDKDSIFKEIAETNKPSEVHGDVMITASTSEL